MTVIMDITTGVRNPLCPDCKVHVEECGADWKCPECRKFFDSRVHRISANTGVLVLDEEAVKTLRFVHAVWRGEAEPLCPHCLISVKCDEEIGAWVCPECGASFNPRFHQFDGNGVIRRLDWWDTDSYIRFQSDPGEPLEDEMQAFAPPLLLLPDGDRLAVPESLPEMGEDELPF